MLGFYILVLLNMFFYLYFIDFRFFKEFCDFDCIFYISLQYVGYMQFNNLFFFFIVSDFIMIWFFIEVCYQEVNWVVMGV